MLESRGIEAGTEQRFRADFYLQIFAGNLGRLAGARQRTGQDHGRDFQSGQELRHGGDFLFSFLGQRTLVVRPIPVWPIGFSMAEEIKFHGVNA